MNWEGGGRRKGGREGGIRRVAFWNVAGLKRKDEGFWRGLEEWDVMVLSETWVEEKDWGVCRKESTERIYMGKAVGQERKSEGTSDGRNVVGGEKGVGSGRWGRGGGGRRG